jgi:hypothetical protein
VLVQGTGIAANFRFSNCWCGNNGGDGIRLNKVGAGILSSMHFDNSAIVSNVNNGVSLVAGVEDVSIVGGSIQGCQYGVNVGAGVSDFSIVGASIGNYAGGGGATIAGVFIAPGNSDRYVIVGNRFRGNARNLSDGGTGTEKNISSNSGIKMTARGTAKILSATSSLQVNHNLGFVPSSDSIFLSANSDVGINPLFVDVNTINENSFIVRCGTVRNNDVIFNWSAGSA